MKSTSTPTKATEDSTAGQTLVAVRDRKKTPQQQTSDLYLSPQTLGAIGVREWGSKVVGEIALREVQQTVGERAAAAAAGDLSVAKQMLMSQASALDAIFCEMNRKAANTMKVNENGTWSFNAQTMETLMRIAFKAQAQCRASLQTLGELVNPRSVAFIQQANMANGPQQVNNGNAPAAQGKSEANELLEECVSERMDTRAPETAGGTDQVVAALGKVHRAADSRRNGGGGAKRKGARA